jgi:glycosyltransferase involved in cell wall biosynthesis
LNPEQSDADKPLVSVIFPMFNVEATVLNSLGTVQDQTYENIEIICVDDGSTDRTVELVGEFSNDPRIRLVRQENRGLGGARNTGIREAKGQWLTFVDSDDWIHPRMIEELIGAAVRDSRLDIIDCFHAVVDPMGNVTKTRDAPASPGNPDYFARVMSGRASAMACGRVYRRSLFDDPELFFPERVNPEDIFVTYKYYYAARGIHTVTKPLYMWNQRAGSLSRSISTKYIDDTLRSLDDCWNFLCRKGVDDQYIADFYYRCAHYSTGLLMKTVHYSRGEDARTTLNYLRQKLQTSPYFSNKMVEALRDKHPELLRDLSKYGVQLGVSSSPSRPVPASPSRSPSGNSIDPRYHVTFAGILVMALRKLRNRLRGNKRSKRKGKGKR